MNGYAVLAFATPVAALALGWSAVAWHRRALRRRVSPEMHAERQAGREEAPDETLLAAIEAHAEETLRKSAQWRAEVEQRAHNREKRKATTGGGAVPAD